MLIFPTRYIIIWTHHIISEQISWRFSNGGPNLYHYKILTNSKNTANAVAKIYSVHPEVIYSGIDTGKYFPKNNKSKFFFTIGRIKKEKNFELLIEIMNSLKDMKTEIIIAGEGDYLD